MLYGDSIARGDLVVFNDNPLTRDLYQGVIVKIDDVYSDAVMAIVPSVNVLTELGKEGWNASLDFDGNQCHKSTIAFSRLDMLLISVEGGALDDFFSEY